MTCLARSESTEEREYQFLLVREHQCDPIALGICERVYRGSVGRNSKPRQQKLVSGSLPAALCTCVHVCLLDETSDGKYWVATSHSLCLILDPHHESGLVLCEINPSHCKMKLSAHGLVVALKQEARSAICSIQGKGWAPSCSNSKVATPIFTVDSFPNTKAGKEQIQAYMHICHDLYKATSGAELTDQQGHIRHLKACWAEIVARTPVYFQTVLLGKTAGGSKLPTTAAQFSNAVWTTFGSVAPSKKNGVKPFLKFLRDVDTIAAKPLPVTADD